MCFLDLCLHGKTLWNLQNMSRNGFSGENTTWCWQCNQQLYFRYCFAFGEFRESLGWPYVQTHRHQQHSALVVC